MDVKIEEKEIAVNAVHPLVIRDDAVILSVDCPAKYPECDLTYNYENDVTVVEVYLYRARKDDAMTLVNATLITVSLDGDWHAVDGYGKWGPKVCLVRKQRHDPLWPVWEGEEEER